MSAEARPAELARFPVVASLRVQWGDQDAFGHVNNTVFLRWFETARVAYLEQAGLAGMMTDARAAPILAGIRCRYRRQVTWPDTVLVGVRVGRLGRASMTMEHAVYSVVQRAVAAEGESDIVVFDYEANRPRRMPSAMRSAIERLEGTG